MIGISKKPTSKIAKLIIDACLSEPPSKIYCFRDLTLYAKCFIFESVLLKCNKGTRTFYRDWLKNYGAYDFIDDLILLEEKEYGFTIGNQGCNINTESIDYNNLSYLISSIKNCKNKF